MKSTYMLTLVSSLAALGFAAAPAMAEEAVAAAVKQDAAVDQQSTAGQYVDDATITTRVKTTLLADKDTSGTAIKVETQNGTVSLSGNVNSAAEKDRAVSLARQTPGVKDVKDMIEISGS